MTQRKSYICANCGVAILTQQSYVRHLLEEAGPQGVTTNQFLVWGAGSRFGARVHELRHEHGLDITEDNELYTLAAGPGPHAPSEGTVGSAVGTGRENPWRRVWMCKRCAYREVPGWVCPRGHLATKGWIGDLRPAALEVSA